MARRRRITKVVIDAMKPGQIIWDSSKAGFGVRCQRRDKIFVFKTRIANRQRWFTIGKYGQPLTVERARKRADEILGDIAKNLDPAAIRDERLKNPTVKEAVSSYLELSVSKRRPATQTIYKDFFERLIFPAIGSHKVLDVQFGDVARLHHDLRKTPITANRVATLLAGFFNWCELRGYRPKLSNPASAIELNAERSRERFLSPRELARLGVALGRAERNATESVFTLAAIRLLIFTGCRRDEILKLKWEDVNLDRATLLLPESKTGSRTVYLSAPALEILSSLPRVRKNPHVIVGEKEGRHLVNLRKSWLRICKVARLKGVRIHDLRHSFASVGATGGVPLQMIGRLLGHSKTATTEKYAHLAADPVKAANEALGKQIASMLTGRMGKVVPLKRKTA